MRVKKIRVTSSRHKDKKKIKSIYPNESTQDRGRKTIYTSFVKVTTQKDLLRYNSLIYKIQPQRFCGILQEHNVKSFIRIEPNTVLLQFSKLSVLSFRFINSRHNLSRFFQLFKVYHSKFNLGLVMNLNYLHY